MQKMLVSGRQRELRTHEENGKMRYARQKFPCTRRLKHLICFAAFLSNHHLPPCRLCTYTATADIAVASSNIIMQRVLHGVDEMKSSVTLHSFEFARHGLHDVQSHAMRYTSLTAALSPMCCTCCCLLSMMLIKLSKTWPAHVCIPAPHLPLAPKLKTTPIVVFCL